MKSLSFATAVTLLATVSLANANQFEAELGALAKGKIAEIATASEVIEAVKAQNEVTAAYDQAKIEELDKTWRAQTDAADQPMIDAALDSEVSGYLMDIQDGSDGLFTEIFVMDAKGLNVGQSDVTSDYWQGDEAKWQETYSVGPDALHISELEEDESTQTVQSQVSVPVVDPDSGAVIGAVTVGVNVDKM
ncbi:hypothetical protein [Stappia sp. ES.058]|uniref:hypothetical protein n=1 Tax=Stappia sp. ES.058 TaxID=1881061 RepID=UPI000879F69D|nr:hypothetical protein [Stappia sp. ES.058]SDU29475.1 hypothetical protein SAMN05428979_2798 [Stappia sp. ES.058]